MSPQDAMFISVEDERNPDAPRHVSVALFRRGRRNGTCRHEGRLQRLAPARGVDRHQATPTAAMLAPSTR
jgi:hypothetical protein